MVVTELVRDREALGCFVADALREEDPERAAGAEENARGALEIGALNGDPVARRELERAHGQGRDRALANEALR